MRLCLKQNNTIYTQRKNEVKLRQHQYHYWRSGVIIVRILGVECYTRLLKTNKFKIFIFLLKLPYITQETILLYLLYS